MTSLFTLPARLLLKRQNWLSFGPELFPKRGKWRRSPVKWVHRCANRIAPRHNQSAYAAFCCLAIGLLCLSAAQAYAGGTGLPWDGPIEKIAKGLSGPVAFLFALGGMVVLGVRWIFGGEMGAMTRSLLTAVAGTALLVFAADFIADLFGVTSALIAG